MNSIIGVRTKIDIGRQWTRQMPLRNVALYTVIEIENYHLDNVREQDVSKWHSTALLTLYWVSTWRYVDYKLIRLKK